AELGVGEEAVGGQVGDAGFRQRGLHRREAGVGAGEACHSQLAGGGQRGDLLRLALGARQVAPRPAAGAGGGRVVRVGRGRRLGRRGAVADPADKEYAAGRGGRRGRGGELGKLELAVWDDG